MANLSYPFYTIFGILPSFLWLLFYLKRDVHPESNWMVLKIFFYGMLAALPAILLEMGFLQITGPFRNGGLIISGLNVFLGVALIEELLKYLVVREKVLKHPELDEPIDIMLYMIIAALGFAASENILILFSLGSTFLLGETLSIALLRFWGATFLHALCSGLVGYFLALSFFEKKHQIKLLSSGFAAAILLHGLYNFSIIEIEGGLSLLIPLFILIGLAVFFGFSLKRLKKLKSICKI